MALHRRIHAAPTRPCKTRGMDNARALARAEEPGVRALPSSPLQQPTPPTGPYSRRLTTQGRSSPCGVLPLPTPRRRHLQPSPRNAVAVQRRLESSAVRKIQISHADVCGHASSGLTANLSRGHPPEDSHGAPRPPPRQDDGQTCRVGAHRQERRVRGRGRCNLLHRRMRKGWASIRVALDVGNAVKRADASGPCWDR